MIKFEKVPFEIFRDTVLNMDLGVIFPTDEEFLRHAFEMLDLPSRATVGSAGYDIRTPFAFTLKPNNAIAIPTGIRCILPQDKALMIFSRSGIAFKFRIGLVNHVAVIDAKEDVCV